MPKQFTDLVGDGSLFERTVLRLHGRPGVSAPVVVTGEAHLSSVTAALRSAGVTPHAVLVEPRGRNTAPACIAAALVCRPEDVMVIVPSDHLIRDADSYAKAVDAAASLARDGRIVTFGITPSGPETGFGYIEMGEAVGPARAVVRFKEKPDLAEAVRLVADGTHVWNSGMFILTAGVLLDEARRYCASIVDAVRDAIPPGDSVTVALGKRFLDAEKISFDHAVMEKTERAVVIPIDVGWDDVGSYDALWEVSEKDDNGNVVSGDVVLVDVTNSFVRSNTRRVALAGLDGVVVVETDGDVLVVPRERSQLVKDLADRIEGD